MQSDNEGGDTEILSTDDESEKQVLLIITLTQLAPIYIGFLCTL